MKVLSLAIATLVLSACATVGSAQLVSYEPFDNIDTSVGNGGPSIKGKGSGFGWGDWDLTFPTSDWRVHKNATDNGLNANLEAGGLSYTDTSGNALTVAGTQTLRVQGGTGLESRVFRPIAGTNETTSLSDPATTAGQTSFYISYIAKREGQTDEAHHGTDPTPENPYSRFAHFGLYSYPTGGENSDKPGEQAIIGNTFITDDFNHWNFSGLDLQADTGIEYGGSEQRFVVLKVDIGAGTNGADTIEMWLDPTLSSEMAANATSVAKVMGEYAEFETETVPAPGDFNDDDVVDVLDYAMWRENVGEADGALLNDGDLATVIGVDHLNLWLNNYGAEAGEVEVVDPGSFSLAAIGIGAGNDSGNRAPGNIIVDEIRIGYSWGDVTPHAAPATPALAFGTAPEPGALMLLLGGLAATAGAARRRSGA